MSKNRKDKIEGKGVLVRGAVVCIAVAAISFSLISGLAAQGTGDSVKVTVNAPEYVEGTFDASIDVDSITDFNSGQFDLSFDSSVVNVTGVADGSLDGETIPVSEWERMDGDTIRVIVEVSGIAGVSGAGNLATISFAVVGETGDKSGLDISNGLLVNTEAEAIPAGWIDGEVTVGPKPVKVSVNAPEYVEGTFDASIDVDSITDFNSGQFDLLFDSNVVNVTGVADGSLDGETIPVSEWERMDGDTIRVIVEVSGIAGVSGAGNLATVSFTVVGETGDKSVLDLSNGLLVNTEAEAIPAEWIDDEVIVGPEPVKVSVNAPEYVEGTFDASIDVDSITDFNSGQFDLSFDSNVVNVTDVADGSLDGETIPVSEWERIDGNTIRVIVEVSGIAGVSGAGNLATISFAVVGETGDKSGLDISNGLLVNTEAEAIPAGWIDGEVIVGPEPVKVSVNAPEYVEGTFDASIDVDSITDFNSGQFDLSFDSSVVNVTGVADGSLDGETIPVSEWERMDGDTIRVIVEVSGIAGVSGAGNLATISFAVVGETGDKSGLDISNGLLVNTEAEAIPAEWIDDEVIVGPQ